MLQKSYDPQKAMDFTFSPKWDAQLAPIAWDIALNSCEAREVHSGGTKRDKLKGTNARDSQFFADFR